VSALADDEMVAGALARALDAGVPAELVERIVAEEAALLDGSRRSFELSAAVATGRLLNVARAGPAGRGGPLRRH
jgi:hypothetical protein